MPKGIVTFGKVEAGIPLNAAEADKLRGEIYAMLSAMNTLKVGDHCTIRNFKLSDKRKIGITASVTAVNGKDLTVDLTQL
jgi:hypothetical protein